MLYQAAFAGEDAEPTQLAKKLDSLRHEVESSGSTSEFAVELVRGALKHAADLDALIARCASNWRFERLSMVDRTVLRLGAYELLHRHDIPPRVTIHEAVELAKRFGGEDSGAFVNGVLDRIFKELVPSSS